tara:strand:- start:149 stop:943 length:795 start_codon:yes stop_codon:yes gene_type:complete
MKKFAVIGESLSHSFSPILHTIIYQKLELNADYSKVEIARKDLSSFITNNQFNGLNITIPYKEKVISALDQIDKPSKIIGAVNCLHGLKGFNTDWKGFLKAMQINNVKMEGKNCLIIGAGGAAKAIAFALFKANVNSIKFKNRTQDRLKVITSWINRLFINNKDHVIPDIIINCTPQGMFPLQDEIPMKIDDICKNQILIDTIYNPLITNWLKEGAERGAKIIGGLDMLIAQALFSINIWFGIESFKKIDVAELKKELSIYYAG